VAPIPNPLTPQPAAQFSAKIKAFTQQFGCAEISPEGIEARRLRLKNLLVLGNSPSYLTNAELNDTLPDEMQDVVVAARAGVYGAFRLAPQVIDGYFATPPYHLNRASRFLCHCRCLGLSECHSSQTPFISKPPDFFGLGKAA
jgi:hypothetical protein